MSYSFPTTVIKTSSVDVTYDGKAFSPSPVTINIGNSVRFINNSTGKMWVASNPHPIHTDLPGFDEKAFIDPKQSWTYTFNVPGNHGYHNHANPTIMGTVIVQ